MAPSRFTIYDQDAVIWYAQKKGWRLKLAGYPRVYFQDKEGKEHWQLIVNIRAQYKKYLKKTGQDVE